MGVVFVAGDGMGDELGALDGVDDQNEIADALSAIRSRPAQPGVGCKFTHTLCPWPRRCEGLTSGCVIEVAGAVVKMHPLPGEDRLGCMADGNAEFDDLAVLWDIGDCDFVAEGDRFEG